MYDVAVAGAGPSGSRLAFRLAEAGYGVAVLEKKEYLDEPVCCTGIIGQECIRSYSIGDDVIYRQANSAVIYSPSGESLRVSRKEPQASIVNRAALNLSLARRAQEKGAEYRLCTTVKNVKMVDDRVAIRIEREREEESKVEARVLVIAGGFGSGTAEELGMGRSGDFVMGVQTEVETEGIDEVEVYLGGNVAPGFFAWLVPTLPGRALAGLLSRRNPGDYQRTLLSRLYSLGKITSPEGEFSFGGIPLRPLKKTYGDRVIVAGSAAGQVKPVTGGGVYYGLMCADIAADNLIQALESDNLSEKNLVRYEKDWKKKLGKELTLGYRARKLYERLSDRQIERIFGIVKSEGIDKTLLEADDLSFDWHGGVILRLIGHKALSGILGSMKLPFLRKQSV